jgi:predicted ATP-grasp superfamily ATP-dependent carboligase
LPKSSQADAPSILVVADSGRALAAAAKRAGFVPLVVDYFADADTRRIAKACVQLAGDMRRGFSWKQLAPALARLAAEAPSPLLGLVYGAGFEARPALLARIAERFKLIGNDAATVAAVKDPERFFGTLARLGIPHPRTVTDRPRGPGWLAKRQGGAGGSHIRPHPGCEKTHIAAGRTVRRPGKRQETGMYFQEIAPGRPVSALFVGNGVGAIVLGFSEQWTAPRKRAAWRYGGAVQPADLPRDLATRLADDVQNAAGAFGLKGLGSADFLIDGEEPRLLEINPRPGATLDIFDSEAHPLLHLHIRAVLEGILPMAPLPLGEATAAAIVYAPAPVIVPPGMAWPDWTSDQPKPGERIDKDRPICTVWARSTTKVEARHLIEERMAMILTVCADKNGGDR